MGFLILPYLWVIFKFRTWELLKLFFFTLPLSLSSLIIYSKDNFTFSGMYQVAALSFLLAWGLEYILKSAEKR